MYAKPYIDRVACVLLAAKVEEAPIMPAILCSTVKVDLDRVLVAEYALLNSLGFDLYTFKTHSSLNGLVIEISVCCTLLCNLVLWRVSLILLDMIEQGFSSS